MLRSRTTLIATLATCRRRVLGNGVAAGRLDLDYVSAVVGEQHRDDGAW